MKKTKNIMLLFALLIAFQSSKEQVNFNMGIGYSTHKDVTGQIGFNYNLQNFSIGGEIRPSITRSTESMQLFGFRGGYNVMNSDNDISIIPFVGYYYNKFSDSKETKGEWIAGYGIRAYKMVTDIGGIYIEPCYLQKTVQTNIGIIFKF